MAKKCEIQISYAIGSRSYLLLSDYLCTVATIVVYVIIYFKEKVVLMVDLLDNQIFTLICSYIIYIYILF